MCTNTSRPPSSGLMKPYPRSPLKNLTVPVIAIEQLLPRGCFAAGPHGATAWLDIHTGKTLAGSASVTPPAPTGGGTSKPATDKLDTFFACGKVGAQGSSRKSTYSLSKTRQGSSKKVQKRKKKAAQSLSTGRSDLKLSRVNDLAGDFALQRARRCGPSPRRTKTCTRPAAERPGPASA